MENWMIPSLGSMGKDCYESREWSELYDMIDSMVEASRNYGKEEEKAD